MKNKHSKRNGNNKGFAVSGVLYPILILTLFLIVQILTMMASRKAVLDKNKQQLLDSVNRSNKIYNVEELSILVSELQQKNDALESKVKNIETNPTTILNKAYPVGSIYISYNNVNPSTLFGGTWTAYGTGRTLVGVDTAQSEFNTVGKTGGSKTHTLTVNEMPKHTHGVYTYFSGYAEWNGNVPQGSYALNYNSTVLRNMSMESVGNVANATSGGTHETGGGAAHNNLQPYITTYMFRRTA